MHKCDRSAAASCVHCALAWIFSHYSDPDSSLIPPKLLRQTLNNIFKEQNRFQMGDIDDAAEALEAVLNCLHDNTREEDGEETCVAHGVFGLNSLTEMRCTKCGESSEPAPNLHFLEYTYADNLRLQHQQHPNWSFERIIRVANQEYKGCPKDDDANPCAGVRVPVTRHLLNIPGVIAFGLVWPTPNPAVDDIMDTLRLIRNEIGLSELFTLSGTKSEQERARYRFRGMICYYGKHYNAYFFNEDINQWVVFDDATVKHIGSNWCDVLNRCRLGHFHPSVLFYEKNQGSLTESILDLSESEIENTSNVVPPSVKKPIYVQKPSEQTSNLQRTPQIVHHAKKKQYDISLVSNTSNASKVSNAEMVGGFNVSGGIPAGYRVVRVPRLVPNFSLPGFYPV